MELEDEWISDAWHALVHGSAAPEERTVLFVVRGDRDPSLAEAAHLRPGAIDEDGLRGSSAVLRAVGIDRLNAPQLVNGVHRFALFQEQDEAPLSAINAILVHELRHAEQFDRLGLPFWEVDAGLRKVVQLSADEYETAYRQIPSERDANRAAAKYLQDHHPDDIPAIGRNPRFAHFANVGRRVVDLMPETLAALGSYQHDISEEEIQAARDSASNLRLSEFRRAYGSRADHPDIVFI